MADFWRARGWSVVVEPTRAAGHATDLANQAARAGHQLILAAGGDGTLGEVANGLVNTDAVMAPLPVGTANSFAKELLMPRPSLFNQHKLLQAAESLAQGKIQRMDVGYTHRGQGSGDYWLLWAGAGVDGYLVDRLEPRPRWSKKLGRLGYISQCLIAAPGLPALRARVEVDGQLFEGDYLLVLVSNCRRYAGGEIYLSPQAKLDDGLLEVWLFRGSGLVKAIGYFLQTKLERHHNSPDIIMVNGRHVTAHTEPLVPCQADGDRAGTTPLTCRVIPGGLRLLVPDTAPNDLFQQRGQELAELETGS